MCDSFVVAVNYRRITPAFGVFDFREDFTPCSDRQVFSLNLTFKSSISVYTQCLGTENRYIRSVLLQNKVAVFVGPCKATCLDALHPISISYIEVKLCQDIVYQQWSTLSFTQVEDLKDAYLFTCT